MSKKPDSYASEEDTLALMRKDARTPAERELDRMLDERGASEQGSEPSLILRQIALELMAERESLMQLFTDPENQPTQYGTVTVEYMRREIAAHGIKGHA